MVYADLIGDVSADPSGSRYSDAAYVPVNDDKVKGQIYSNYYIYGRLNSQYQAVGMDVSMHGAVSGKMNGKIDSKYYDYTNHPKYGTVYDQILATYKSKSGDSGAPITNSYSDVGEYIIYGIHSGSVYSVISEKGIYSPQEAVFSELNLSRPVYLSDGEV